MPFCYGESSEDMAWDSSLLAGPDGEDWRVPVSELEDRQRRLARELSEEGIQSVFIEDPVEIYWLTGGRQNSSLLLGSEGSGIQTHHWVRRSLERAVIEGGGSDSPHITEKHPKMSELEKMLTKAGCTKIPSMQEDKVPGSRLNFIGQKMKGLGGLSSDCSRILYYLREKKSDWEISRIRESGEINKKMFDLIVDCGGLGKSELEMAGAAEQLSRSSGFGGIGFG